VALSEPSRVFWAVVRLGAIDTATTSPPPPSLHDLLAGNVTNSDYVTQGNAGYDPTQQLNVGMRLDGLRPTTRYDVHVIAADVAAR
jgi:hypothetical protein